MKHCKQAFTLIELLVVICIIAILASMLLPALQSARDSASSATCVSNLGQFAKAFQMYVTSYDDFMPMLTDPQTGSKCGWVDALVYATGQTENISKAPLRKSLYCDADTNGEAGSKKSYSLNNLQEAVHPRNSFMLDSKGGVYKKAAGKKGYISGNRTTAVFAASDLIIIGENVSSDNGLTSASFNEQGSNKDNNIDSPGTASAVHQYVAIKLHLTSHKTAGNLFLDGHVTHAVPEKTLTSSNAATLILRHTPTTKEISDGTAGLKYCDSYPTGISIYGFGAWTDCIKGKLDSTTSIDNTTCDGNCHARH